MAQNAEMQVTPEEARFLRRFFRRQALPWLLALAVLAIAAARWAVPPADPGIERRLAESTAAIEALRAESAALRTRLEAVGQQVQPTVDRRIAAAESRIAALEKGSSAGGDASRVAERVARLEDRLASAASANDTVTRSNLARLKDLESRMGALEGDALPAAPAP
jgi:predicted  nucleic acid-binding Zn-ribbon protein